MAGYDPFADIALTAHPVELQEAEFPPQPITRRYLTPCAPLPPPPAPKDFAAQLADFEGELARLREQYRPFLQNLLPPAQDTRRSRELTRFDFRFHQSEDTDLARVLRGEGEWQSVSIPHYTGPEGKWTGYYRLCFDAGELLPAAHESTYLCFRGVDYIADVYLNGRHVGSHEGFFAPFELDVTPYLLPTGNTLLVQVRNDVSILGEGVLDGDKIYAATGLGWDDPQLGWHHCPAGAGIYNRVFLQTRSRVAITNIAALPDIDGSRVQARIRIQNDTGEILQGVRLSVDIHARNFTQTPTQALSLEIPYVGVGSNEYRYYLDMRGHRLWEPETPWLYTLRATIAWEGRPDTLDQLFGMRKFISDESSTPKGRFYLNNRPVMLRGANEMGHLQQCVLRNDDDQLVDDILIAKLCNMNYYRITQRPVQQEIYEHLDMLGMMSQCDFPLFGFLRRNQLCEAVRQVEEMEQLIRSHPSCVLVTFINEPMMIRIFGGEDSKFTRRYFQKGHRHLLRDELEAFFRAAREVIYVSNPHRVIKNVEGDYDPPTGEGMPDFHTYTMWYTNHAMPIGKLYKGYLPPFKAGWYAGCGEYGAEGLDHEALIRKHYPQPWLDADEQGRWYPSVITKAQTYLQHADWYPEQQTIADWVRESQAHQALATRWMTDALRRRADLVSHSAIHLLIDAWPAGWMKTLLGVDRVPKPAYFAYRDSLVPLRVNIRTDRLRFYTGEQAEFELWLLNDGAQGGSCRLSAGLYRGEDCLCAYECEAAYEPVSAAYAASVRLPVPDAAGTYRLHVRMWQDDRLLNEESLDIAAYAPQSAAAVTCLSDAAAAFAAAFSMEPAKDAPVHIATMDTPAEVIEAALSKGRRVVLLADAKTDAPLSIAGHSIAVRPTEQVYFAAIDTGDACTHDMQPGDLSYLYNAREDYMDYTATLCFEHDFPQETMLVYTYQKKRGPGPKPRKPIVSRIPAGGGELILYCLNHQGLAGVNPTLDAFTRRVCR